MKKANPVIEELAKGYNPLGFLILVKYGHLSGLRSEPSNDVTIGILRPDSARICSYDPVPNSCPCPFKQRYHRLSKQKIQ